MAYDKTKKTDYKKGNKKPTMKKLGSGLIPPRKRMAMKGGK
jgi:hypothetical protein